MIINYQDQFEDSNYVNEVPEQLDRLKHDKNLID